MNLLLDTHILIWMFNEPEKLSAQAKNYLISPNSILWVSAISLWEISIKARAGKLRVPDNFCEILQEQNFRTLAFQGSHAQVAGTLPSFHHDPFDRALIAQAKCENMRFLTSDKLILAYKGEIDLIESAIA